MKCNKCSVEFEENELDENHDVPCYLFWMHGPRRQDRKPHADKYERRYICNKCHKEYEIKLHHELVRAAIKFGGEHFDTTST